MILKSTNPNVVSFNNVFDDFFRTLNPVDRNYSVYSGTPVNIVEGAAGYTISLFAPGRMKEKFKLNVESGLLTISYEAEQPTDNTEKFIKNEYKIANFKRTFSLSDNLQEEGIQAKYVDGILNVFVPKKENVKITPKQITIE